MADRIREENEQPCSARELGAVGLLIAALVLSIYAFGTQRVGLRVDDAGQYLRMAEAPESLTRLPYTFRVLSPLLARAWPGDVVAGFTAVTIGALVLACVGLYGYQRALGLSGPAALAGAALFAGSGASVRMLTTPVYVDAATYATEAAAFLFLASRRYWPLVATLSIGVLNRETVLLLIPLCLVAAPPGWRHGGRLWLLVGLPVGVLAGVVLLKLWSGGVLSGQVPLTTIAPFARTFRQDIPQLTDLFDLYSVLGIMWVLALKNLPGPTRLQRRALLYGALVALQLLVSRGDEGRNLSHLFVIVVPLAMLDVEQLLKTDARRGSVLAGVLVLACAMSMVHARWTLFEPAALRYALVAVGSAGAVAIVAIGTRIGRSGAGHPRGGAPT